MCVLCRPSRQIGNTVDICRYSILLIIHFSFCKCETEIQSPAKECC